MRKTNRQWSNIVLVGLVACAATAHAEEPAVRHFGEGFFAHVDVGAGWFVTRGDNPPVGTPNASWADSAGSWPAVAVSLAVGHSVGPRLGVALRGEFNGPLLLGIGGSEEEIHAAGYLWGLGLDALMYPFPRAPLFVRIGVGGKLLSLGTLYFGGVFLGAGVGVDVARWGARVLDVEVRFEPAYLPYTTANVYTSYDRVYPFTVSVGLR